jgi:acyl transferase domain-containing protein/acyl carrier protein
MSSGDLHEIERALCLETARLLRVEPENVAPAHSLGELGMDSIKYVEMAVFIQDQFDILMQPEILFEHASIRDTAAFIAAQRAGQATVGQPLTTASVSSTPVVDGVRQEDIAIVGAAFRLPGASRPDELWRMVTGGSDAFEEVPVHRWGDTADDRLPSRLRCGVVNDAERFDAAHFGISPREAIAMDPQQRLLLECAWNAFLDAGYGPPLLSGTATAVFVGASTFDYYELLVKTRAARFSHLGTGVSHAILANRLSQLWNLRGASEAIDTACSSSLVALWRAVETLRHREAEMVLVAGVNVFSSVTPFLAFCDAGMLNGEGQCLPFDERAAGYVRGEGVVCVVLKRALAAVAEGDRILGVIKGGAVRHSGRTQSLTAPNPDAQAEVIIAAIEDAQVAVESIGYLEAHGTGTTLGDPIEIRGIKKAFAHCREKQGADLQQAAGLGEARHFIGSIKAQIGHLEAAAGLAGVVKALACLQHRTIPGNSYLRDLNSLIELVDTPFRIPVEPHPWEAVGAGQHPRRAGVSAFGFGGTNAHIVLQEAPRVPHRTVATKARIFLLSGQRADALRSWSEQLAGELASRSFDDPAAEQVYLEDLAFTLRRARTAAAHRVAIVAAGRDDLVEKLRSYARRAYGSDVFAAEATHPLPLPAAASDLANLAAAWAKGADVDWCSVLPRGEARIVTLPPYPFFGERFWPKLQLAADGPAHDSESSAAAFWVTRWKPSPLPVGAEMPLQGSLFVVAAGVRGQAVAQALGALLPSNPIRVFSYPASEEDAEERARTLAEGLPLPLGAWIDLTAFDEDDAANLLVPKRLEFLRQVIGGALRRGEPLKILQATCGLQDLSADHAPQSLAGAAQSAVYELMNGEYRRCRSRSVDFTIPIPDPSALAIALLAELGYGGGGNAIAYADGRRLTRTLERASAPSLPEGSCDQSVAMITGGTGNIGIQLAKNLVERGFRALLLTGRRDLTRDSRRVVTKIEHRGVAVSIHRGSLEDAEALAKALEAFVARNGPVTHVFHCAGAVDATTPAFYRKTAASMEPVFAPKVNALRVLHHLFLARPPKAFVLFSSVSSVMPRLAAGALDYAAANRYLDLFAHYQHARGFRYYRSVQWTRWDDLGIARMAQIGSSGLAIPLSAAHCLDALHRILAAPCEMPSLCVLARAEEPYAVVVDNENSVTAQTVPPDVAADETGPLRPADVLAKLRSLIAAELETSEAKLDDQASFEELGIDSIVFTGLIVALEEWLGQKVDPEALIHCNSIAEAARYLGASRTLGPSAGAGQAPSGAGKAPLQGAATPAARRECGVSASGKRGGEPYPVAVVGIACRFPGAAAKEAFWRNLVAGVDSIGPVPPERWDANALYAADYENNRTISRWGGFIDDIETICPGIFGMSTDEAAEVDPLIRLFSECSLAAIADTPLSVDGMRSKRVGVFAGARAGRYAERIAVPGKRSVTAVGQNFIAAYVSHLLDLRGPSLVVDSACSSSLAAIHLACQSLRSGDSEIALAGGVEVLLDEKPYLFLSASHALSLDGHCRPFSAGANGFTPGEGVGCVVLKPLECAISDSDPIYAVIIGSAMNNDGHTLGITTPGSSGQVDVIERALLNAQILPRDISYVEAHGTGTLIGDPIELQSLSHAFEAAPPNRCGVGSVKSNIGHLLSAAGVASFIKAALALHHRVLPPTLHCEEVNPRFQFDRTPFYPVTTAQAWDGGGAPRRAGISAFGFGKTNVHMILEERPAGVPVPLPAKDVRLPLKQLMQERVHAWLRPRRNMAHGETADGALLFCEDVLVEEITA